ncbi:hypothetical protein ACI8AC_08500 [Geodermatophilus sp. SYSU D00758]
MTAPEDPPAPGRTLVEAGSLVAGSMARTAATLLFDPSSARVRLEPALAEVLRRAAAEAAELPGSRAGARAGAALAFAAELAVTRAAEGRAVRSDRVVSDGRTPLDELAGEVLREAAATAEEWRVRHLGYLLAETAVSPDLDAGAVRTGLRLASGLTGRQLAWLAAVGRRDRVPLPMAPLPAEPRGWPAWGALEDLGDLQRRGLLDPPPHRSRPGGAALPRLRCTDLRLTRRGVLVHRLLVLDLLRDDLVAATLADLGLPRS